MLYSWRRILNMTIENNYMIWKLLLNIFIENIFTCTTFLPWFLLSCLLPDGLHFLSVRVTISEKRHHDHGNYYKGKCLVEGACLVSEVQSIIIKVQSMVACRQIWLMSSWEFYVLQVTERQLTPLVISWA